MDMDYEENIVAEGTEEFVVDADKQAKFMESSKERMNKICIQLAYLEKEADRCQTELEKLQLQQAVGRDDLNCGKTFKRNSFYQGRSLLCKQPRVFWRIDFF